MIEDFVTDLPDGALPSPSFDAEYKESNQERPVCDEVTLTITILYNNKETKRVVASFALDSPYWIDKHDAASARWSLALPHYEMMKLLCTYLQSKFMKVTLRREELLT